MDVQINKVFTVTPNDVKIGEYTLSEIISGIYDRTLICVQNISIERQSPVPNLDDIDVDLYSILNLIEEIQR